jgi:hypothetical protein
MFTEPEAKTRALSWKPPLTNRRAATWATGAPDKQNPASGERCHLRNSIGYTAFLFVRLIFSVSFFYYYPFLSLLLLPFFLITSFLRGFAIKSYKNAPIPFSMSVCLSTYGISRTAERIFIKFYIDGVLLKFVHAVQFGWNRTAIIGTLHGNLYAFLRMEVNKLGILASGIPSQPRNHMGESSVITLSAKTALDTPPTNKSLIPENSVITGAIQTGQTLANVSELLRCVYISLIFL